MIDLLLEPFSYQYMINAIVVCGLVGATCSFLSCFLMLKGWSLMGDALAHSVVPGVALAYLLALPYAIGAAASMAIVKRKTHLREDAVIGIVFTSFFAAGLLLASINPIAVNIQTIVLGNILAISESDILQVTLISIICLAVLSFKWRDLMAIFFDETHAASLGLNTKRLNILFFALLSAACVAALQTVGACLVIAMVVTPGATAYLLTDKFERLILLSLALGTLSSIAGTYTSFFVDLNPGGLIVCIQTALFFTALIAAPKHGLIARKGRRAWNG